MPGKGVAAERRLTHRWGCSLGKGDTAAKKGLVTKSTGQLAKAQNKI